MRFCVDLTGDAHGGDSMEVQGESAVVLEGEHY